MKYSEILAPLFFILLFPVSGHVAARNVRIEIAGGEIHVRGRLTDGACTVSADSQDLHIDMGLYTTHSFERVGDQSAPGIPFTIRLTDCQPGITSGVNVTFSGMTAPKEPDVFQVTTSVGRPLGISGDGGFSGLGLLISDSQGNQIIPGREPEVFHQINSSDLELHYIARYRASSHGVYPGELHSEVRFDIAYP